jgi:hypothetical protein
MLGLAAPEGVPDDVPNGANNDGARDPSGQSTSQDGSRFRDVERTRIAVKQYTCTSSGTQTIVTHTQGKVYVEQAAKLSNLVMQTVTMTIFPMPIPIMSMFILLEPQKT